MEEKITHKQNKMNECMRRERKRKQQNKKLEMINDRNQDKNN